MEYFMDNLQSWEVYELYDGLQYADSPLWELTRWLMYIVALVNSKKQLKLQDILKFPWEQETISKSTSISKEDIKRLKEKAKRLEVELCKQ